MDELKQLIQDLAAENFDEITGIRRHLHQHPELSFNEYQSSAYICSILDKWGVDFKKGFVKTGIVAEIQGGYPGQIVALRADMDALPIQEENDIDYKSVNAGVMHACGHDVHSAAMLGVIKILLRIKDRLRGKVKIVFQPGEERLPGGAKLMLEENLFGDEEPDLMIAQHVYPDLESGKVGFKEGMYMASSDEIFITIKGKGGHAALPDKLTDTVLIASQVIVALQQIVSRNNKPGLPTVLSFGKVEAAGAVNVIPDVVKMEGTFRTMDESWRAEAHDLIERTAFHTAAAGGAVAEVRIVSGYPVLKNDSGLTKRLKACSREFLGDENVTDLDIRMTAEDFSYFSGRYPSCLFRLGVRAKEMPYAPLHTSGFQVDEKSLELSTGLLSWFVANLLT